MSLNQSARMNGHDPYAYLKDVLTQRVTEVHQLLPHQWSPSSLPKAASSEAYTSSLRTKTFTSLP